MKFTDLITHPELLCPANAEAVRSVVSKYPWFTAARVMLHRAYGSSPGLTLQQKQECEALQVDLSVLVAGGGAPELLEGGLHAGDLTGLRNSMDIIDKFLGNEEGIALPGADPQQTVETIDMSVRSVSDDGSLATETLAQIYRSQGLKNKAIETYRKLSLKYPEKSVYFAALIDEIKNS